MTLFPPLLFPIRDDRGHNRDRPDRDSERDERHAGPPRPPRGVDEPHALDAEPLPAELEARVLAAAARGRRRSPQRRGVFRRRRRRHRRGAALPARQRRSGRRKWSARGLSRVPEQPEQPEMLLMPQLLPGGGGGFVLSFFFAPIRSRSGLSEILEGREHSPADAVKSSACFLFTFSLSIHHRPRPSLRNPFSKSACRRHERAET